MRNGKDLQISGLLIFTLQWNFLQKWFTLLYYFIASVIRLFLELFTIRCICSKI